MVPVAISPLIDVMVTVNLWLLGKMKIQSLIFLVQPESYAKTVSAMLQSSLGFIIPPTLPLSILLVIQNHTLLSPNMITLPLRKANFLRLYILS